MKKLTVFIGLIAFFGLSLINAQTRTVTGTVTSAEDGIGIPGVNVIVKGTTVGTATDLDGNYSIVVPEGQKVLTYDALGFETQEITITGSVINVVLNSSNIAIDEVMVVAFGTAKKESFTGSAAVVGSEKLQARTLASVGQALEGSTTGVQVAATSGQPGSSPDIRVRGFGTLNGDASPLFVVDGSQYEGSLADISPDDIASMTILKDASSTALYGSRAANGVILITTKTGKRNQGAIKMDFKGVTGVVTQAIPHYETVGAEDYYELMFQSYKNSLIHGTGQTEAAAAAAAAAGIKSKLLFNPFNVADDQIVDVNGNINPNAKVIAKSLDWYEPIEQTGYRQDYSLSASGGGEKHDFFFSLGYLKETGYVKKSDFERFNSRMNVNATPKEWLKVGTNLSWSQTQKGLASTADGNNSFGNPFRFARYMGPIYPVYELNASGDYILDEKGEKIYDLGSTTRPVNINRHVAAEMEYNYNNTKTNIIGNRSYAEISILKNLKFSTNVGVDVQSYVDKDFENNIVGDGAPDGRYSETRYTQSSVNANQLLNYNVDINEDHSLEILVGHESYRLEYSRMYGMKSKLNVTGINEFDNFVTPTSLDGATSVKATEGFLGRLKYNFKNKYYFEGSFRRDGSSVFHPDNRWGNFFSVGATWRMDQEEFIKKLEWVDQLKFRVSYGQVGNDRVGIYRSDYYAYQALYEPFSNALESGLRWKTLGNDQLTWESNNSFDVALEYGIFNNKLRGSIEFYHKISEDLLYNMPLATSLGLSSQPRNIATLYNQGFEIGVGATLLKVSDFAWDIDVQTSTVKNEITSIPSPFINGSKRWDEGHSVYDFYLHEYAGVDPQTGAALYYVWEKDDVGEGTHRKLDANGNRVTTEDEQAAGFGYTGDSSIPDLFGAVTNSLKYKNFNLSFMFTYAIGGKILDYNYAGLMNEGEYGEALHVDQLNAWKKAGDVTDIPRLQNGNTHIAATSSRWLTDASYLSLKNVNLSYTFPKSKVTKLGLSALKVFAAGENLFMLAERKGLNPQEAFAGTTSNVYLPSRVVSFGVNVSF